MDAFSKLSREAQVVLVGCLLLLILSFFDWQQVSFGGITAGLDEWHGFPGILAGLLVIAVLAWEVVRVLGANVSLGTLSPGLVSVGLVLLMALFTVIAFFDKSEARHWPAWIGLILAVVVAAAAVSRARTEGVEMPQMAHAGSGASSTSAAPAPPAEPAAPAEPVDTPAE